MRLVAVGESWLMVEKETNEIDEFVKIEHKDWVHQKVGSRSSNKIK